MNLLFVADPLETFKTYKDSTYAMMREAQVRGHRVFACEPHDLRWSTGGVVEAHCRAIRLTGQSPEWFTVDSASRTAIKGFDAVLMRKDPPFDSEYFYVTHLLEQAEREGARVFNKPRALRDHPEKLAILEFPALIGRRWSPASRKTCATFMRCTKTSSSSPLTVWAAWAFFGCARTG